MRFATLQYDFTLSNVMFERFGGFTVDDVIVNTQKKNHGVRQGVSRARSTPVCSVEITWATSNVQIRYRPVEFAFANSIYRGASTTVRTMILRSQNANEATYQPHHNLSHTFIIPVLYPYNVYPSALECLVPNHRLSRRTLCSIKLPRMQRYLGISPRTTSFRERAWVDDKDTVDHLSRTR